MTTRKVLTGNPSGPSQSFHPVNLNTSTHSFPTRNAEAISHLLKKIQHVKQNHIYQLNQLDLNLETTPRDSRYSNHLMDLMKKEEMSLRDSPTATMTKTIIQKVDESLKSETRAFFQKLTHQNLKKYELLREKYAKERDQLKANLLKELQHIDPSITTQDLIVSQPLSNNLPRRSFSPNHVYTAEDIAREEERLQADYYEHWYDYESIHLAEAFRLQNAKIDNDWLQHELQLKSEYDQKKAPYLPKNASNQTENESQLNALASTAPQLNRWHNAEKQKTLIHTAPVFTPSTHQLSRPSSAVGRKSSNTMANALEVERLDKEYQEALALLHRQKADAKRWLSRQQIRLNAQSEEIKREKSFIGQLCAEEMKEMYFLETKIHQLLDKAALSTPVNGEPHSEETGNPNTSYKIDSSFTANTGHNASYLPDLSGPLPSSVEHARFPQHSRGGSRPRTFTT